MKSDRSTVRGQGTLRQRPQRSTVHFPICGLCSRVVDSAVNGRSAAYWWADSRGPRNSSVSQRDSLRPRRVPDGKETSDR